jgi:SAM-dependent methyltransferase
MAGNLEAWELYYSRHPVNWKGSLAPLPELPRGSRVLDIGCGTGSTVLQCIERGYEAAGIDISPTAVKRARERLLRKGCSADVLVHDAREGLDRIGNFDCILLHHVLDALCSDDRARVVRGCRELLGPGGLISFQDFSVDDVRYGSGETVEDDTFVKGSGILCHFFRTKEVMDLFPDMEVLELDTVRWRQGAGKNKVERSRIVGLFRVPRA